MNENLTQYYAQRAAEYEAIYHKPERQADLQKATLLLQDLFSGKNVLEIACGTGYWTQKIAHTAREILATDLNASVLEVARAKTYAGNKVQFQETDLYDLPAGFGAECLFGGFIWSHILLEDLPAFTTHINGLLKPGGMVVFMDNLYVSGSSTPIVRTDARGNTFQERRLQDGSTHMVLKNFPDREAIEQMLGSKAEGFRYQRLDYFWICVYQTPG